MGLAVALLLAAGCSKTSAPPSPGADPSADAPGLGEVMLEVGRRFETAGKAASANRFELAAFEVGEVEELFEGDVPRAKLPKEGPTAQIPALAKDFLATAVPELDRAAASHDPAVFAAAFQHAAAKCNACHASSAKGFIQVPSVPGQAVPVLDPIPTR